MKYFIRQTKKFNKSLKKMLRRGKEYAKLRAVVEMLAKGETLPAQYKDHPLIGNYKGHRDCHIENDWVLIYKIIDNILVLTLADTGTHSDLGL